MNFIYQFPSIFLGIRYFFGRSKFTRYMSFIYVLSISLGICLIVTSISIRNGLEREICKKIFYKNPIIYLYKKKSLIANYKDISKNLKKRFPEILNIFYLIKLKSFLIYKNKIQSVFSNAIEPKKGIYSFSILNNKFIHGNFNNLMNVNGIIISNGLANNLNVNIGKEVKLFFFLPNKKKILNFKKSFKILGIFNENKEFKNIIFLNLKVPQSFEIFKNKIELIGIKIKNFNRIQILKKKIKNFINNKDFKIIDFKEKYYKLFKIIKLEKRIMYIFLSFIIMITIFNSIFFLSIIISNKKKDLSVLRTLGLTTKKIFYIFFFKVLMINLIGIIIGTFSGILLSSKISRIIYIIEKILNIKIFDFQYSFINHIPYYINMLDISYILIFHMVVNLIFMVPLMSIILKKNIIYNINND